MMKKKFSLSVLCVTLLLLGYSCIEGIDLNKTYEPGVYNTTMVSPNPEDIVFTTNAEVTSLTVSWPVVLGAGGYYITLTNVDDPENPEVVLEGVVDGSRLSGIDIEEDQRYIFSVRTLGNEAYNNKDAEKTTQRNYSTYLPTYLTIPAGSDLSEYIVDVPYTVEIDDEVYNEVAYELEPGAEYKLTKEIKYHSQNITIRSGDKTQPNPKITVSHKITTRGGGLKLKYLDFDMSSRRGEFILFGEYENNDNPAEETSLTVQGDGKYVVANPVLIRSCNFEGFYGRLVYTSAKPYYLLSININDCVFECNQGAMFFQFQGNSVGVSTVIRNSTFANSKEASSYRFYQMGNLNKWSGALLSTAALTLENNTFYNMAYSDNFTNYNTPMNKSGFQLTVKKNIFEDCGNKNVASRLAAGSTNPVRLFDQNVYWYDGSFVDNEIATSNSSGDHSGTALKINPQFKDPTNWDFTPDIQLMELGIGDPRWWGTLVEKIAE